MKACVPRFIGAEIYRASSYGPAHPLRVPRVSTVMDLSRALGWLDASNYTPSPRAKPAALTAWHTPDYIAALIHAEEIALGGGSLPDAYRLRHGLGTTANPMFPQMFRRPATSAGAAMLAAEMVVNGGVIYAPGGGTHHGMPDHANGFCYLNDPVLSILTLRRRGIRRIAYVDIDAHHCDGVQHAFAGDADTLLISTHEENRWPFTGRLEDDGGGNCVNLPLPKGLNDAEMAVIRDALILPRLQAFRPEAIVLQCGADALQDDPLSRLSLSNTAHWSVVAALRPLAPRYIVLGGGGYNPWSVGRCWAGVWATLAGFEIPDRLPATAEAVLRALTFPGHSKGRNPPDHWFTTLRDPPNPGPVRPEIRDRLAVLAQRTD